MDCKRANGWISGPSLVDLPQPLLQHIAEFVPLPDLPNLICTCKYLAFVGVPFFYTERRCLDMRSFLSVSPKLCLQVVRRFSGYQGQLESCFFRCDPFSAATVGAGMVAEEEAAAMLSECLFSNYSAKNSQLVHDICYGMGLDLTGAPDFTRAIDVLWHCHTLRVLLGSQPKLKELEVDMEYSIFYIPRKFVASSRCVRHWQMSAPFVALEEIHRACPLLERYLALSVAYQASTIDLPHLRARFLQKCPRLRLVGMVFALDTVDLSALEIALEKAPLALERADFTIPKWTEKNDMAATAEHARRMQVLARKMPRLKRAVLRFSSRGALARATEFLTHLPCIRSLCLASDFRPGFDLDENLTADSSSFFGCHAFEILPNGLRKLYLLGVPEDEFEIIFCDPTKLPSSVSTLVVRFQWSTNSPSLDERKSRLLDHFLSGVRQQLTFYRIEASILLSSTPVFVRTATETKEMITAPPFKY